MSQNESQLQESLFEDPVGLRFRHARERMRMDVETAARKIKVPAALIEAIEREHWQRLGAPVYARSYLGAYAKLLGLPQSLAEEALPNPRAPELRSMQPLPPISRGWNRHWQKLSYVALTVVILAPLLWLLSRFSGSLPSGSEDAAREASAQVQSVPVELGPAPAEDGATDANAAAEPPLMASLTPMPTAGPRSGLQLVFTAASWVDVRDLQGRTILNGLMPAGTQRVFEAGSVGSVVLGDADAVEVELNGRPLDLAPYRTAKVARFAVSSALEPRAIAP
jgi:cytoskeleton protein RodZ